MSGIDFGGVAPTGLMGVLVSDSASVSARVDTLTQQAASGRRSDTYAGLGTLAKLSIDLRPQLQRTDTYTNNISQATTKLQMTGSALQQLSDIASNFATQTINMSAQTSPAVDSIAAQARLALQQVQALLNTQSGGQYLFAGQDTANPPVPDAELAAFVAAVQAPVTGLTATNATAVSAATLAAANATPITSATLGMTRMVVEAGDGLDMSTGVIAGQNAYAVQTAANSTGSYVKDLVRGLASLAAMNSGQTALGAGFVSTVTDIGALLGGVVTAAGTEMAGVGQQEAALATQQTSLTDTATALTSQISSVEDVDMAATATALSQVQTQLQASYRLISGMRDLSLVGYL